MQPPVKSILVYADGRVEDTGPLEGEYFFKYDVKRCDQCGCSSTSRVVVSTSPVERRFKVHAAMRADGSCTMVGIEVSA